MLSVELISKKKGSAETPNTLGGSIVDRNRVQYLFVSQLENDYSLDDKFVYCKVTFSSLNDRLADSGYSIASYVQPARAGEGYAWPLLEKDSEGAIKVVIDKWRTIDVGVWGCQIKIDNTAIIHSIRLQGFPVTWDYKEIDPGNGTRVGIVFAPRPLFPKHFLPAVNHPLNTQLKAEDNYILVVGIQPVVDFYQEWKENKKSAYDESVKSSFEGHIRTNYKATTNIKFTLHGKDSNEVWQIWKNFLYVFGSGGPKHGLPDWPEWLVDRVMYHIPLMTDWVDAILDMPRSLFSNVFSRKLPQWGNMNEKIKWIDLAKPTLPNVLALNAFAHHDIVTLPMGKNDTITTETLDVVEDVTSRIPLPPKILSWINNVVQGFHYMIFGKSPSGFKKGGVDHRLNYYGDSMVGIMSKTMYDFYTGPYYKSLNEQDKGILALNAFQNQGDEPLSTLLNATSNTTVLNFKLTDLIEASVYNKKDQKPAVKRVEIVSTVHIAQEPLKEWEDKEDMKTNSAYQWQEGDIVLVDKNFNTLTDPRDKGVIARFGKNSDSRRLYAVNEVCVQAIGAGDMTITFFAEDPTVYGYEQVSIWEGKFRNNAKITGSTRGWTTTIRFGQPVILDEDGKKFQYNYPRTIQHEIQKRPNLPPPPYDKPKEEEGLQLWTYSYTLEEEVKTLGVEDIFNLNADKDTYWSTEYEEKYKEEIPLVYSLPHFLVWYLDWDREKEEYTLFASSDETVSESKYRGLRYYKSKTAGELVNRAKTLQADKWWYKERVQVIVVLRG